MRPTTPPTIAVVLVNLGTPDAPTVPAVRSYLKQFLSDTRVIEIPKLLWAIILNLFVLPNRPKRVAAAYASIWQDGDSPMRLILNEQVKQLQARFDKAPTSVNVKVLPAMTYGKPGLEGLLTELSAQKIEQTLAPARTLG